jgi:catechol 2,3-dioxygenase-like lactoylglutathione lyase family enzyme
MTRQTECATGFHHIALACGDIQKSLRFYVDGLCGKLDCSFEIPGKGRIYMVDLGGGAKIELLPWGQKDGEHNARWAHIALVVKDAAAAFEAALAAGASVRTPPTEGILNAEPPIRKINAFVFGPDGEVIEFFQTI